jgi:hypothetical protein
MPPVPAPPIPDAPPAPIVPPSPPPPRFAPLPVDSEPQPIDTMATIHMQAYLSTVMKE